MKKFIMCCPMQKVNKVVYKANGNNRLEYNKETAYPMLNMMNGYIDNGESVEVILVCPEYDNCRDNKAKIEAEISELAKDKNFSYEIKIVSTPYSETIETHLKRFTDTISLINDNDTLFICNTYGSKPTPIIQTMVANYAYRALNNVTIGCIVYGQYDHETGKSTIYDITALFHMDEIVNNLAKLKVKNPSDKIRQILSL